MSPEIRVAMLTGEIASLERFYARREQLMEGLDWSAFSDAFCREASMMHDHLEEEIAFRLLEIEHLERMPAIFPGP